jgi:hypothetical protein
VRVAKFVAIDLDPQDDIAAAADQPPGQSAGATAEDWSPFRKAGAEDSGQGLPDGGEGGGWN